MRTNLTSPELVRRVFMKTLSASETQSSELSGRKRGFAGGKEEGTAGSPDEAALAYRAKGIGGSLFVAGSSADFSRFGRRLEHSLALQFSSVARLPWRVQRFARDFGQQAETGSGIMDERRRCYQDIIIPGYIGSPVLKSRPALFALGKAICVSNMRLIRLALTPIIPSLPLVVRGWQSLLPDRGDRSLRKSGLAIRKIPLTRSTAYHRALHGRVDSVCRSLSAAQTAAGFAVVSALHGGSTGSRTGLAFLDFDRKVPLRDFEHCDSPCHCHGSAAAEVARQILLKRRRLTSTRSESPDLETHLPVNVAHGEIGWRGTRDTSYLLMVASICSRFLAAGGRAFARYGSPRSYTSAAIATAPRAASVRTQTSLGSTDKHFQVDSVTRAEGGEGGGYPTLPRHR
ncbi:hypothetical protein K0M31_003824 [Melipona bicolor]|uniref:Uncharacterized protein n=1 Tax=Melipona bicolor TaxID=60889 RepID=A0AA40FYC0_9HYME|nr:hypothetical protein K0M31_003824 [Melipona bicolor]